MNSPGQWYCVRTQPKHEHIAAGALRQLGGVEVYAPQLRQRKPTRRGPVWYQESVFPGYIFAQFCLAADLPRVQHTGGVLGVVRFGAVYPELPPSLMDGLKQAMGHVEVKVVGDCLLAGGGVRVLAGAFAGWEGVIARVANGAQRVQVLLEVLGRMTRVDLPAAAIAPVADEARGFLRAPGRFEVAGLATAV